MVEYYFFAVYNCEMADFSAPRLTKTDFMIFLHAPLHLWAEKNGKVEKSLSSYELHLLNQGQEIEGLARKFLLAKLDFLDGQTYIAPEQTFTDGNFQSRIDTLAFDPVENVYDLYEIKSSTSIKTEHKYDVTFQALVCEASIPVRSIYLVLVNKDYVLNGELDISQFFTIVDMREDVEKIRKEVAILREEAWKVAISPTSQGIEECVKPNECICPSLCHPDLPPYPIYDLTRLHHKKARDLKSRGVLL